MSDHSFFLVNILGMHILISDEDVRSLEDRFAVLSHDQVSRRVYLACGYLKLQDHIIAVYNLDESMHPVQQACQNRQYILLLRHKLGLFGLVCNEVLPLKSSVQLYSIPESMDTTPSPFTQYATMEKNIYPVLSPCSMIDYLDSINQQYSTDKNTSDMNAA